MEEGTAPNNQLSRKCYPYPLLSNVHRYLSPSSKAPEADCRSYTFYTKGDWLYFHDGCDGFKDNGWGCAYRTLQSVSSWIVNKRGSSDYDATVPSIKEIQQTIVQIGYRDKEFVGSHDSIGAIEVFYTLDTLYDVVCKIIHVAHHDNLKKYASILKKYFEDYGGLVIMCGDKKDASKGIAGLHISGNQVYLLVIDPHFVGVPKSVQELVDHGCIRWQHTSEFVDSSFYNICLPQLK